MSSNPTQSIMRQEEFTAEFARRIGMSMDRADEILEAILTLLAECANGQCPAWFLETLPVEVVSADG